MHLWFFVSPLYALNNCKKNSICQPSMLASTLLLLTITYCSSSGGRLTRRSNTSSTQHMHLKPNKHLSSLNPALQINSNPLHSPAVRSRTRSKKKSMNDNTIPIIPCIQVQSATPRSFKNLSLSSVLPAIRNKDELGRELLSPYQNSPASSLSNPSNLSKSFSSSNMSRFSKRFSSNLKKIINRSRFRTTEAPWPRTACGQNALIFSALLGAFSMIAFLSFIVVVKNEAHYAA